MASKVCCLSNLLRHRQLEIKRKKIENSDATKGQTMADFGSLIRLALQTDFLSSPPMAAFAVDVVLGLQLAAEQALEDADLVTPPSFTSVSDRSVIDAGFLCFFCFCCLFLFFVFQTF